MLYCHYIKPDRQPGLEGTFPVSLPTIPLFPLNTVLFPRQPLPLHIFEPRYRAMIGDCVVMQKPFGVVLIRSGDEVGETPVPFEVGTTAAIKQIQRLEDGRMNILCVGVNRFRIHELLESKQYLTARVELLHFPPPLPERLAPVLPEMRHLLDRYLQLLKAADNSDIKIAVMPSDGEELLGLAEMALQVPLKRKQSLLEIDDLVNAMITACALLRSEVRALQISASVPLMGEIDPASLPKN
jgi:Lon protease-like protein